jgi:hypothetical protein
VQPTRAASLPPGVGYAKGPGGGCVPSDQLADLLVTARSAYDWPSGTGAATSQATIIALEASVGKYVAALNADNAHRLVLAVSRWAGNNAQSHEKIVTATEGQKTSMQAAIAALISSAASVGIDALCKLPGISLVIASKIYRFCSPSAGAAVDRHASYFFNSLAIAGGGFSTSFRREWSNKRQSASRLAIYSAGGYALNQSEYFKAYLPTLRCLAAALNAAGLRYRCSATGLLKSWVGADVEMAAYYWWAINGAR